MKKNIAILGLSRFGLNLVESFSKLNVDLIAIDIDKESVQKASELTHNAFIADSTSLEALKELGVQNVDHAIVAIGQAESSNLSNCIMSIIALKELGIKEITARADDDMYIKVLKLVGATSIIAPFHIASERIANKIAAGNIVDYYNIKNDFDVFEIEIASDFKPLHIIDLDSRGKFKINILLIERNKEMIIPDKETILYPGDDIFIFGPKKNIGKVAQIFNVGK